MISFEERSYGGGLFLPRPEIEEALDSGLLCISRPWGPRKSAKDFNRDVKDHYLSINTDSEVTSPFERLTCLSKTANNLRISLKLANDNHNREYNRETYQALVEHFSLILTGREIYWAQIGQIGLFLLRNNSPLMPLAPSLDLSTEYSNTGKPLPPLPSHFLGADIHSDFKVSSFLHQTGDQLFLVSRSFIPTSVYELDSSNASIEELSRLFVQDNETMPFWIGHLRSS